MPEASTASLMHVRPCVWTTRSCSTTPLWSPSRHMAPSYGGTRAAATYALYTALHWKSCELSLVHHVIFSTKTSTGTSAFLP